MRDALDAFCGLDVFAIRDAHGAGKLARARGLGLTCSIMTPGRRAFLRISAASRVDWRARDGLTHVVSTTRDWSRGGVFIHTSIARPRGARLTMRFEVGGGCIELDGTVVHQSDDGMGVCLDFSEARAVAALRGSGGS
jgi:hypothetical protein